MSLLDEETLARVNPFDWLAAFPEVFKDGGFDVVIGNPPYIRIQALKEWAPTEVEFYKRHYISASQGNYDIYVVFLEKGIALLRKDGKLGFILPHKFFNAEYGESLRGLISNKKLLSKIVHFGDNQVFKNATTYTCLIFLNLACEDYLFFEKVNDIHDWRNNGLAEKGKIPATFFSSHQWNFPIGDEGNLFEKLNRIPKKFENVALRIFQGIKTSADKIYIVDEIEREEERVKIYSYQTDKEFWLESDLLHPLVKSGDIKRYRINKSKRLLLFPYLIQIGGKYSLISESILENDYPLIWEYLKTNKTYLENRENGKIKGKGWYGYIYPKNFDVIIKSKIITPDIAYHSSFALDETGELYFTGGTAGGYGILISPEYPREYMLGLLNSKLLEWFLHKIATSMRGGWFSYEARFIRNLPIKIIESSKSKESSIQDKVISLVKKIVNLNKKSPNTPQEKEALKREIEITTSQIDQLVYEIYGLTEEEIRIVEGN